MVWSYAYSRRMLNEHNLRMTLRWHEDEEFTPRALYYARRMKFLPLLFYRYYKSESSFMQATGGGRLSYKLKAVSSLYNFCDTVVSDRACRRGIEHYTAKLLMPVIRRGLRRHLFTPQSVIREIEQSGVRKLHPKNMSFYYFLYNISPSLFVWYYYIVRCRK